jgi:glyoxylase-like metal-dependent hydrolase (beta-lactamase superfamily II)
MEIHALDLRFLGKPHVIAAYLVVGSGGPVLVESGPGSTLENLKLALADHGFVPADIRYVLLTHIHLDHAGAAGWWAQQGANIYVHYLGAPHLVDPAKLLASAARIYGDQMDRLWGEMLPVPANRLTALCDGDRVRVAGLTFTAIETPGHARHHHAYRLEDVAFTGDVAGIHLPDSPLVAVPAPPPEFDLEAWRRSVARLARENFVTLYPTHFGGLANVREHLATLDELVVKSAEFVERRLAAGATRDQLVAEYTAWERARAAALGVRDELFDRYQASNPLFMSVDGLTRYWRKREEARHTAAPLPQPPASPTPWAGRPCQSALSAQSSG